VHHVLLLSNEEITIINVEEEDEGKELRKKMKEKK